MLSVSPWTPPPNSSTPRAEPERDGFAGQMEAGQANERQETLAYGERHGDHRAGGRGDGPAHDFDPALKKGEGGPSGPPPQRSTVQTHLTSSTGLATGHTMSCRPIGALRSGALAAAL